MNKISNLKVLITFILYHTFKYSYHIFNITQYIICIFILYINIILHIILKYRLVLLDFDHQSYHFCDGF